MAGLMQNIIDNNKPKTNNYIKELLSKAELLHDKNSHQYRGIYNQYFLVPSELDSQLNNSKHFHADTNSETKGGMERMYRRVVVVDLVSACASECSYCVRGYYPKFALSNKRIDEIVANIASTKYLKEVLITGGDPFVSAKKLMYMISKIEETAENIHFIRIGTRIPVQSPNLINGELYNFFDSLRRVKVEVACQVNHPFELQQETCDIFFNLKNVGVETYSQNVLLKGVNDNIEVLYELYDKLRYLGVLPHYFFHAVPLKGTDQFRTSVQKGLDLIQELTSSGYLSGRAKPQYALITDVGKVNLYQGAILEKNNNNNNNNLIIKTSYKLSDRQLWNSSYKVPKNAKINSDGTLTVKYKDGKDI